MTFACKKCEEKVTDSKMVGLVLGQLTAAVLKKYDIDTRSALSSAFSKREVTAGTLSSLGVKCPNCRASNWD